MHRFLAFYISVFVESAKFLTRCKNNAIKVKQKLTSINSKIVVTGDISDTGGRVRRAIKKALSGAILTTLAEGSLYPFENKWG